MIRTAIKFGLFVLLCLSFTLYLAFTIGNLKFSDPFGNDRYELTASFDDVTGLLINDNVKIAGVVVGKVTGVSTDEGRADVTFMVDKGIEVPEDSRAAIRWRNLIGQRYLYLYPGDSSELLTDGRAVSDTESVVDLGELFNRLGPIVSAIDPSQVNEFLDTITAALGGREADVGQIIDDLATLTNGLADRDAAIGRLLTNLETVSETLNQRDAQIAQLLDNLTVLAQTFGDNTDILDASLVEFADLSTHLDAFLETSSDDIDRLLTNLAAVTGTVESKLPELDRILSQLDETSDAIFRAGSYGEFLNQKILCASTDGSTSGGCPAPVIMGLEQAMPTTFDPDVGRGADVVSSILGPVLQSGVAP